ncbi:MipA/OmpV family protein [Vibrio ostreicida]|uniref:MipA/OmpV family protein n=1 Tax=Vibrio ostreicida TaxID=526588 RepID=A0ABT8BT85_9VIBR|nr:MipA/OmpV family protein [Vibrio ostreicida]MDN3610335.1 MipA/OmpV family protein [Vibrio ostreicida]
MAFSFSTQSVGDNTITGLRYTNLQGEIDNSPLIESGVSTSANIGIAYVF